MTNILQTIKLLAAILAMAVCLSSCIKFKKVDTRKTPINAQERAKLNVKEGRGLSLKNMVGNKRGNTNFEFSTSNPMWRASLETLDFLPLVTVDYSGGIIITDWYSDQQNSNDAIKITLRFLSNEVNAFSPSSLFIAHTLSLSYFLIILKKSQEVGLFVLPLPPVGGSHPSE